MKKIIMLPLLVFALTGCEKYLDKNPQEGGLSKFTTADQYDGLLNNIRVTRNRFEWVNAIQASDDHDIAPEWQQYVPASNLANIQKFEGFSIWNREQFTSQANTGAGAVPFQSTYNYMYDF
ncbi:MAG: membrane lipoprotein lipid attachment site-containing protein, partial [Chitinophagaceae bacterium]